MHDKSADKGQVIAHRHHGSMPWDAVNQPPEPQVQRGMELIGAAARRARRRHRWSQRDLEERTGIDQTTISRFENGLRCGMRWSRFATLVAVLDGLDFGIPDQMPEPVRWTRRSWIEAAEAELEASVRRAAEDDLDASDGAGLDAEAEGP